LSEVYSQSPRVASVEFKACTPSPEICGNGIDDDCTGGDALCPTADFDNDGYENNSDCDAKDHSVYPGVSVECKADCGDGVKTCQAGGSFSACSCDTLCESKGSGRCFYVNPVSGNDNNSGSYAQPLKTVRRLVTYASSKGTSAPANRITLIPGDVIYLMSGVYQDEYVTYEPEFLQHVLKLNGVRGTSSAPIVFKAYPGNVPVISPAGVARGIEVRNASHIHFHGIQIKGASHAGVAGFDSDNLKFTNMTIYDTDGVDNDNPAGLYFTYVNNLEVSNSVIHDNYDRTCADTGGQKTENSRNIVLFKGGNVKIHHNYIYQSQSTNAQKTGSCLVYKHSQSVSGGLFEVYNNVFRNCFFTAVGNGGYGGRIHHNLILNSDTGVMVKDMGGNADGRDNIVEYNTFVNTTAFEFNPSQFIQGNYNYGTFTFRNNVISDDSNYGADAGGIFDIDIYGSNAAKDITENSTLLVTDNNCFFNAKGPVKMNYFASNSSAVRSAGDLYSLSGWKNIGYDVNSVETNPLLSAVNYKSSVSACSGKGW